LCRQWVVGSEATPREKHWVRRGNGSSLYTHSRGYGQSGSATCSSVAIADGDQAATRAQAVRCASRARPCGEGPCPLPLAEGHSRRWQCRCTRTGGAQPLSGEAQRGGEGVLLLPSRCLARPTGTGPQHKHRRCSAHARRDPTGRALISPSPGVPTQTCSARRRVAGRSLLGP